MHLRILTALIAASFLCTAACSRRSRPNPVLNLRIADRAGAVDAARRIWDDYRRRNHLTMHEMRVAAVRRMDGKFVVELWPANPGTYGGGVIVDVPDVGEPLISRIIK